MSARSWHQIKFARTRLSVLLFPRFLNSSGPLLRVSPPVRVHPAEAVHLFSGASGWRANVLPASRRQMVRSCIVSFCRQDAGSTL